MLCSNIQPIVMKSFIEGMVCLNMCSNNFVVKLRITTGFNYISTVCGCTKICKIHMYFGWQGTCPSLWGNRTVPSSAKHDLFCHLMCSCKSLPLGLLSSDHTIVVVYTCICSSWYITYSHMPGLGNQNWGLKTSLVGSQPSPLYPYLKMLIESCLPMHQ